MGVLEMILFLSYSTADLDTFRIPEIVSVLEQAPTIEHVYYWGRDCVGGQSIIAYMRDNVKISDVFLAFSTETSRNSDSVSQELEMAVYQHKRIIPVYL